MPKWTNAEFAVPAGGATGGLLSMILPRLGVSTTVFPSSWWTFPAGMLVGAVAAFIGVFLLFNTDRSDKPRLISWAILLGLLWQPVIAAGSLLVENVANQKSTENRTTETVAKIAQLTNAPPTTRNSEELSNASTKIVELAQRAGDIHDEAARHAVGAQLAKAIEDLEVSSKKNSSYQFIAADTIWRTNKVIDANKLPTLKAALNDKSKSLDMAAIHKASSNNSSVD